jgi:hypothetical protein
MSRSKLTNSELRFYTADSGSGDTMHLKLKGGTQDSDIFEGSSPAQGRAFRNHCIAVRVLKPRIAVPMPLKRNCLAKGSRGPAQPSRMATGAHRVIFRANTQKKKKSKKNDKNAARGD